MFKFKKTLVDRTIYNGLLRKQQAIEFVKKMPGDLRGEILMHLSESKAQIFQDLFVLAQTRLKTGGTFVEFGATDGITLSNTHLLEKKFGWTGLLAEPARQWQASLSENRSARLEFDCIWSKSNVEMDFVESYIGELSTLQSHLESDFHGKRRLRRKPKIYKVNSISLTNALAKHQMPNRIDFLSIDTEGSEFDILAAHDFEAYSFGLITCEHNFTDSREKIFGLLRSKGYTRVREDLSSFDDWYVLDGYRF